VLKPETLFVGVARVGQSTQKIVAGTLEQLVDVDFGPPLHSVVICGETHELEDEVLRSFMVTGDGVAETTTSEDASATGAAADGAGTSAGAGAGAGAGAEESA